MTQAEILALAIDAAVYDAVVVLWVTERGTQPVLLRRSLGRTRPLSSVPQRRATRSGAARRIRRPLRPSGPSH